MGFFEIFWGVFWVFLLVAWFWVVISVITDVFRSKDIKGVTKALWVLFIIIIPWLGVLAYIIVRGDEMEQHRVEDAKRVEEAQRTYLRSVAGNVSVADELEKLSGLKDKGVISDAEFEAQKTKLLAG